VSTPSPAVVYSGGGADPSSAIVSSDAPST
jgi:hypothetical protein